MNTAMVVYTHKSATLIIYYGTHAATLTDFHSNKPKKGHGAKLLRDVLKDCDKKGIKVLLEARSGSPKMTTSKLVKFYKRFGFVKTDTDVVVAMERNPKGK